MKAIAFDLGGVLFDFDYNIALYKIKDKIDTHPSKIIEELYFNNFAIDFEKGIINSYDFYLKFKKNFLASISYEEFVNIWCDIFSPKEEIITLVKHLSVVYPVYLISNINELHFDFLYQKYKQIFDIFEDLILSFKIKDVKPNKKIYNILQKIANKPHKDILYIDDREDLIKEAKLLGFDCIRFIDIENLTVEFEKRDIAIPSITDIEVLSKLLDVIKSHNKVLFVGVGNVMRADDGVGVKIIEAIKDKVSFESINVGLCFENYIEKIIKKNYDLIIFLDAGSFKDDGYFKLLDPKKVQNISLYSTHDCALDLNIKYLRNYTNSDILVLLIKALKYEFNGSMSMDTQRAEFILKNFLLRIPPLKTLDYLNK